MGCDVAPFGAHDPGAIGLPSSRSRARSGGSRRRAAAANGHRRWSRPRIYIGAIGLIHEDRDAGEIDQRVQPLALDSPAVPTGKFMPSSERALPLAGASWCCATSGLGQVERKPGWNKQLAGLGPVSAPSSFLELQGASAAGG